MTTRMGINVVAARRNELRRNLDRGIIGAVCDYDALCEMLAKCESLDALDEWYRLSERWLYAVEALPEWFSVDDVMQWVESTR